MRRYSPTLLLQSFSIYIKGTKAYEVCRKFITLPSIRHMRRLSSLLKPDPTDSGSNIKYLAEQVKHLKDYEKFVCVKIDEVSLVPSLQFQGEQVMGYAENSRDKVLANSCQAFMISSIFSKYQEIVKLTPVRNQTHVQLKKSALDVLDTLNELGFIVLAITSDNHATNRKLFYDLCGGNFKIDKKDRHHNHFKFRRNGKLIHCFFDAPHMWKCIRNNWINLDNYLKCFVYPENDKLVGDIASFEAVYDLYDMEKSNITKYAPKLNINTVTPTSWGRQNVKNALNIFDPTTSSGLVQFAENDKNGKSLSTASFLKLFNNMWEILNIKTPRKGIEKRIAYAHPFSSKNFDKDFRIKEINDFINWLEKWESEECNSNGKLTSETFHSLIISFRSLLSFLDVMFIAPE